MASTMLPALEPCRECHGVHTTSYGEQRCVLRKHRIEMEELRAENAELRRRVVAFEDIMGSGG